VTPVPKVYQGFGGSRGTPVLQGSPEPPASTDPLGSVGSPGYWVRVATKAHEVSAAESAPVETLDPWGPKVTPVSRVQ
jgi:hypothetical protein